MGRRVHVQAFERIRVVTRAVAPSCPICLSSDGLLTLAQAAGLLQVGEPSIRRWLGQGKAHGFKTPSGHYRICRNSLLRAID
ncbi:MAG: helix-turn-helix domain-containing protein [Pyrinomonadaceae bacterium]